MQISRSTGKPRISRISILGLRAVALSPIWQKILKISFFFSFFFIHSCWPPVAGPPSTVYLIPAVRRPCWDFKLFSRFAWPAFYKFLLKMMHNDSHMCIFLSRLELNDQGNHLSSNAIHCFTFNQSFLLLWFPLLPLARCNQDSGQFRPTPSSSSVFCVLEAIPSRFHMNGALLCSHLCSCALRIGPTHAGCTHVSQDHTFLYKYHLF